MNRIYSTIAMAVLGSGLLGFACGGSSSSGPGAGGTGAAVGGAGAGQGGGAGPGQGGSGSGQGGAGAGQGGGTPGDPDAAAGGNGAGGQVMGDAAGAEAMIPTPVPVTCEVAAPQCNDGIDNDKDGKFDSLDPECVGPCDNDEGSFATGIAGDNIDACKQDCFFDGNSGMGDDGCDWNLKCDSANPGGTSCPYDASYKNCPKAQSAKCVRNCQKLTPNGCDCFGCCAVTANGQTVNVMLVASCTTAKFGDAAACPRCTQNTACVNTCEKCEVCIGRPAPDASCGTTGGTGGASGAGGSAGAGGATGAGGTTGAGGSTGGQCAAGVVSCGPGGQVAATACGVGYYCQTGCCIQYVID
jgi:hypothetical protein